jgi:outer membrane receptor for ferric coprogen and ferric-rhodotorulic acid
MRQKKTVAEPASSRRHAQSSCLALALLVTFAPMGARAGNPGAEDAETERDGKIVELDPVVATASDSGYTTTSSAAATKIDLSPRDTPQSITVITRERLDDQNLTSLRQVLDNTTGVYSDAYDSERVLLFSRGFLIDTLMVDGVPAQSSFDTGSINETLDTALYDRIEVVRGATGLMSGAGNPAASINLVRKHADSKTADVSTEITAGTWRDGRVEVDATTPLNADGSVRARGVAVWQDQESYQALYHKKTGVLYGIVDWDVTPSTLASFGFDHQSNRPRANTWGSFPLFLADGSLANWPRSVTTAANWSYWNRDTDTVFAELRHRFDNDWTVHAAVNWRRLREDNELLYLYGFPDPQTGEGLQASAYKSDANIIERAVDVYASGPFDAFGRRHELVVGYNGSRSTNTGTESEPVGDLADPGNFFHWDGSYPRPEFGPSTPLSNIDTIQNGIYAASRWSLADPLKLIAGARYTTWKIDSFYVYDSPPQSNLDYRKTIPYAGLVYDISPTFSLFASYTGIFKPQNARDIDGHYLDPIEGKSYEIGIKGEHFDGALNTALTVFDTKQDNVAAPVFDPETGEPVLFPDGSQVSRALDGTRSRGFELEVAGRLSENWQTSFGLTRTLMHDATGVAVRTFIPRTLLRTFATWTPREWIPGLTLGAGINWQADSSTFVSSPDNGMIFRQGSFAQLAVMAKYDFSEHVTLQLNANNVLDKKYYVLDEYDNTYYGAPASASLTLRLNF